MEAYRFEFFQAVRLLHVLYPDRQAIGHFAAPWDEVVSLRAHLSLEFPASDIMPAAHDEGSAPWVVVPPSHDMQTGRNKPAQLTAAFGTLTGPAGVLPGHYTTLLLERALMRGGKKPDSALRDFLDIFNHRLLSLLYRAWEKRHPIVQAERHLIEQASELDDFSRYLHSLIGMGTPALSAHDRLSFPARALLSYSGLLSGRARSAAALREVVTDWLGLQHGQVEVEQFVGAFIELPREALTLLGMQSCIAGTDAIVGDVAWVQDGKFLLRIGPLSLAGFTALLPPERQADGSAYRALVELVRFFVGPEQDFDVQLLLGPEDLSRCVLGAEGDFALRVGMTAWLLSDETAAALSDTVFAGTLTGLPERPFHSDSDGRNS